MPTTTATLAPFGHPFYVMAKPIGSSCNLSCRYCYYLSKGKGKMDEQLLEAFIQQYIEAQTQPEILFTWHGGEPLLLPISYYQRALEIQQKYAHGRVIDNCLQTNGTLLTDEWCQFFKANHFLIGISIDGPEHFHNTYRQDYQSTLRGIRLLQQYDIAWNAMATINHQNADHPIEFYRFFKELGCQYLQFTPVVELVKNQLSLEGAAQAIEGAAQAIVHPSIEVTPESVTPQQWGTFLVRLYDEWIREDVGNIFVQLFDATLANWVGAEPGVCSMSTYCGLSPALQPDGSLYSCDHFVFPSYKLGNIRQQTIAEMMYGPRQHRFGLEKRDGLSVRCQNCDYLFACHGECLRNRFLPNHENYLCAGYHQFFEHVTPTMDFMAVELSAGRAPANVMNLFR